LSSVLSDGSRHVDERLLEEFQVQRALFARLADEKVSRAVRG
jgi:hypothetical protein